MEKNNENAVEFYNGDKTCTVTFTNVRMCNRMKKLHEKNPDKFERFVLNEDGSVYARIPLKWLKITAPRETNYTEEERIEIANRLKAGKKND